MKKYIGILILTFSLISLGVEKDSIPTISVQGVGTVKLTPDRGEVQFQVITSGKEVVLASEKNKKIMSEINEKISSLKIKKENIKTTDYSINKLDKVVNEKIISEYEVRNGFQITVENISQVSKIVTELEKAGVNSVNGINFYSSKEKENQNQAMILAYKDALEKASIVAKSAGYKVSPQEITYDYFSPRGTYLSSASLKNSLEIFAPQSLDMSVNVRVVFRLVP